MPLLKDSWPTSVTSIRLQMATKPTGGFWDQLRPLAGPLLHLKCPHQSARFDRLKMLLNYPAFLWRDVWNWLLLFATLMQRTIFILGTDPEHCAELRNALQAAVADTTVTTLVREFHPQTS